MNSQQHAVGMLAPAGCASVPALEHRIERLKSSLHLAVIYGGDKSTPGSVVYQSHNTRSWKSYEAVANDIAAALRRLGFRHVELMPEDMRLGDRLRQRGIHIAWLNTGGVQGHSPVTHAASMLEMLGVPYVGHDPLAATMLDNKHAFKRAAICAGLPTSPFMVLHHRRESVADFDRKFECAFGGYKGPFVVKPVSGRASLHVHVVSDLTLVRKAAEEVRHVTQNSVLIERFLSGRELCVAVSGPIMMANGRLMRGAQPTAFSAIERVLKPGEQIFTSMDRRPITPDRTKLLDATCDAKLLDELGRLARETYLEFDLGSVIRLDLRADERGKLHILEANPKPDLKAPAGSVTSLICAGLSEIGVDYDELILSLLADRLDFLFTRRPDIVKHLVELAETRTLFELMSFEVVEWPGGGQKETAVQRLTSHVADLNTLALNTVVQAAEYGAKAAPDCLPTQARAV